MKWSQQLHMLQIQLQFMEVLHMLVNNQLYLLIQLEIIFVSLRNMMNKDIKQYVNYVN